MQVDDVVMNVIGKIIGYLFFVSIKLLRRLNKYLNKEKVTPITTTTVTKRVNNILKYKDM